MQDQVVHHFPRLRVERAERLVHQQHFGRGISARAIATRCCMPPESWFGHASGDLAAPSDSTAHRRGPRPLRHPPKSDAAPRFSRRQNLMFSIT
jgi:hypothetical protein